MTKRNAKVSVGTRTSCRNVSLDASVLPPGETLRVSNCILAANGILRLMSFRLCARRDRQTDRRTPDRRTMLSAIIIIIIILYYATEAAQTQYNHTQ